MYKQKLEEQIKKLEALQEKCGICDVSEFVELGSQILSVAKKLDEISNANEATIGMYVDGKKVHETVQSINLQSE